VKKFVSILLACLLVALSAQAFGEVVRIGATPVPHAEILEFIKPMMAEKGFTLEVIVFNDYVIPNTEVEQGGLEANYFQHTRYMNNFNAEQGTHLVAVVPVHFEPMGIYKGKTTSLDELPDGGVIAVPNDTTNAARALLLLESYDLIELDPDAGITASKLDIISNPKNLEIVELEAAQIPIRLQEFDLAVINGNYAMQFGLWVSTDAVGSEGSDALVYRSSVNYIVVKEGNEDAAFVQAFREALNDETTIAFMTEKYQGAIVLALDIDEIAEVLAS